MPAPLKSKHEMEKKLEETVNEMDLSKEKLAVVKLSQKEANSLSNIVHSENLRLEHDVAFLRAILDDTNEEFHSTRRAVAGKRARASQPYVGAFHLKQTLQPIKNRAPTPRKSYHVSCERAMQMFNNAPYPNVQQQCIFQQDRFA